MKLRKWLSLRVSTRLVVITLLPTLALAATDDGTLSVGHKTNKLEELNFCFSGYSSGSPGLGSYSPTGLTGDETIKEIEDANLVSAESCTMVLVESQTSILIVSGFSIDPGQAWVTSITCNGLEKTGASAANYSYSSGSATWSWSSDFSLIGKYSGTNVACAISHS